MNRRFLLESLCFKTFAEWYAEFVYETLVPKTFGVASIPGAYQAVEYIEATGTQYIDTGIAPGQASDNLKVTMKYEFTSNSRPVTDNMMFGSTDRNINSFSFYGDITSGGAFYGRCYATATGTYYQTGFATDYPSGTLEYSSAGLYVNGTFVRDTTPTVAGDLTLSMYIFGRHRDDGFNLPCGFKLFSFKMEKGGAIVRDFVPCYRKSDSVIGLYDKVSGVFFTNQGTGTFTKGNDITATANNIGKSNLVEIEGNGVVENQLVNGGEDEKTSVTAGNVKVINYSFDCVSGHKYLCSIYTKTTGTADTLRLRTYFSSSVATNITQTTNYTRNCIIVDSNTTSATAQFEVQYIKNDSNFDGDVWAKKCEIIDLTLMFGTGNEPSSLDDKRIQEIIARGYIPYNTGSYKVSSVESVRFNQYNLFGLDRIPDVLVGWNTARTFDLNKFYTGITCNNYSNSATVSNVSETENSITFTTSQSGYGIMFPVRVVGGRTYTLSSTEAKAKAMSWYDKDGNFITWKDSTNTSFSQAAPTNAYYCGIVLRPDAGTHTYTNICFCETGIRTDYAKHISYLPSLYQQVEYIESSGTQYIDSGIVSSTSIRTIIDHEYTSFNNRYNRLFGTTGTNGSQYGCRSSSESSGTYYLELPNSNTTTTQTNIVLNQRHILDFNNSGAINLDGTQIGTITTTPSATGSQNISIFRQLGQGTSASAKIYSCKMYDGTILIRNFIPCYRKTDNVIGLYDTVGGQFYVNAGTGTFTKGSDMKPKTNEIALPAPVQLGGAINTHDTFEITKTGYVFTRNVVGIDMGDIAWREPDTNGRTYQYGIPTFPYAPHTNDNSAKVLLSTKYACAPLNTEKSMTWYNNDVFVSDSTLIGKTAAETRTALTGIKLYYPLATPQKITIPKKHLAAVDLGSLSWNYDSANTRFFANFSGFKSIEGWASSPCNLYCSKYISVGFNYIGNDKSISGYSGYRIYITDKIYSTASDFKASLSSIYLFYETDTEVADFDASAQFEVGGTVTTNEFRYVENQLARNGDISQGTTNWHTNPSSRVSLSASNGVLTAEWLVTDYGFQVYKEDDLGILNHKYLVSCLLKPSVNLTFSSTYGVLAFNALAFGNTTINANVFTQCCGIITATNSTYFGKTMVIQLPAGSIGDTVDIKNAMVIDLTVAFGSGNEPTSVNDSRIQYLLNKGYIPYNSIGTETAKQTETLPNLYVGLQEE